MDLTVHDLPASLRGLAERIGLEAVLVLVERRGGRRLFVPAEPDPGHWLYAAIGPGPFAALVDLARGDELEIPRCAALARRRRNAQLAAEHAAGASQAELAARHGLTERGVREMLRQKAGRAAPGARASRRDTRTGDLFSGPAR